MHHAISSQLDYFPIEHLMTSPINIPERLLWQYDTYMYSYIHTYIEFQSPTSNYNPVCVHTLLANISHDSNMWSTIHEK